MRKKIFDFFRDYYLRKIRWRNYNLGQKFHAGRGCHLWAKNHIVIGRNFYMGRFSQIECDAVIGNYVFFGNNVALVGKYDHEYQRIGKPIFLNPHIRHGEYNWKGLESEVRIEDDVWLGYGTIVLSGVTIKTGSIIAAGSVVTRDVEPFSIYAGVPAKKVGKRFNSPDELEKHRELFNKNFKNKYDY